MAFVIDDIAIVAAETAVEAAEVAAETTGEVTATTAELVEGVGQSAEILGDGIGEASLNIEEVETMGEVTDMNSEVLGDGIGETALNTEEIKAVSEVTDVTSEVLGDGLEEDSLKITDDVSEAITKYDDNGKPFMSDGKLMPNNDDVLSDREVNEPLDDCQEVNDSDINIEQSDVIPDSISDLDEGMGKANKEAGCRRECEVEQELDKKYPESKGYDIISEAYLRNENGEIVQDPISGERRRIDFVVVKDNSVVDSIEVTSETADKTQQMAKEERIREAGGNFVRTYDGTLAKLPDHLTTHIERRA